MTSQVILEDGSESPLSDHLREVHRKGTRGLNDEYLASLHRTLHQRKHEPQPEPEPLSGPEHDHEHPDDDAQYLDEAENSTPASA